MTLGSLAKSQGYATAAVGKCIWGRGARRAKARRAGALINGIAGKTDWNQPLRPGSAGSRFRLLLRHRGQRGESAQGVYRREQLVDRVAGQAVAVEGKGKDRQTVGIRPLREADQVMTRLTDKAVAWIDQQASTQRAEEGARPFLLYFAPNAVHEPVTPAAEFSGSPFRQVWRFRARAGRVGRAPAGELG